MHLFMYSSIRSLWLNSVYLLSRYLNLLTCFSAVLLFFSTFSHHILFFSTSTHPQGPLLLLFLLPFILMMFLFIFPPVILFLECFYKKSEGQSDHKRYLPTLLSPGKSVLKRSEDIVQSPVSGCISASHSFSRPQCLTYPLFNTTLLFLFTFWVTSQL